MKNTSRPPSSSHLLVNVALGHVMIATIGTEVPIVTVAIDVLHQTQHITFAEVVIIHTEPTSQDNSEVAKRLNAAMDRLAQEMSVYMKTGIVKHWRKVRLERRNGQPMPDIWDEHDEDILFNKIDTEVQHQIIENRVVHLNAAGGRKSMTLYAMSVAHLRFRDHDRLWLLVSSDDFIASRATHMRNPFDAKLIRVPVIRPANSYEHVLLQRGQVLKHPKIKDIHHAVLTPIVRTGASNDEIADLLHISVKAVESRLKQLIAILSELLMEEGIQNRMDLIRIFAPYYQWREIRGEWKEDQMPLV